MIPSSICPFCQTTDCLSTGLSLSQSYLKIDVGIDLGTVIAGTRCTLRKVRMEFGQVARVMPVHLLGTAKVALSKAPKPLLNYTECV